jgi:hypothetical protein
MSLCHDHLHAGHFGFDKTLTRITERYYWPGMRADIERYVKACTTCNGRKMQRVKAPMGKAPLPSSPFEVIAVDTMGPLPVTSEGNKYIITFICMYSSWPEAFAVPNKSAETVAKLICNEIIPRHSCPRVILSDNGKEFRNKLMDRLTKEFKIHHVTTSPYHPSSNGKIERWHRTVADIISCYVSENHSDWDEYIGSALSACRTSVNKTSQFSPFYLLYGRDATMPLDTLLQPRPRTYAGDHVSQATEKMHKAYAQVQERTAKAREQNKKRYDRRAKERQFEIG